MGQILCRQYNEAWSTIGSWTMIKSLGVLGCGNMASALVKGIWNQKKELSVSCFTPSKTRAELLAKDVQGKVLDSLAELPSHDVWMIGCKPQQFEELAKEIKGKLSPDSIVISIMAGIPTSKIADRLSIEKVVRVMPNTPTLVGEGISLLYMSKSLDQEEAKQIKSMMDASSSVYEFSDEEMIDKLSGFTASGPAYVFEWTRIFANKAMDYGVEEQMAYQMAKELLFGSSKMMMDSPHSPEDLREQVTSKKGITYEALKIFEKDGLEKMTFSAIE
ncbi:MAG: pyrroline-5-carboxylate reductase, partial [Deltaproteobacteria bacterium]